MKRREFTLSLGAAAVLTACGGGGGGGTDTAGAGPNPAPAPGPGGAPAPGPAAAPTPVPAPAPGPLVQKFAIGTNLASMELGEAIRFGPNTLPNVNFTVPRQQDVDFLRDNGFTKSRLPIRWEMLQPALHDSNPNAAARAMLGIANAGEFHEGYAKFITDVLDAHAKAGTKCIIDVHNYGRYTDFVYQPDGSVIGLAKQAGVTHAYTTDGKQVRFRVMALVTGATLKIQHYENLMKGIAQRWKDHPGLGGYGMMNEPFALPKPGSAEENDPNLAPEFNGQDLNIWPTFANAGAKAIRAIDPNTPIYLGGNNWHRAWGLGTENPGFPIDVPRIVYDVHCYLDSTNSGQGADWDLQVSRKFTAGVSNTAPIDEQTGVNRLKQAIDFAKSRNMALALTETGMPTDDPRWQRSWENMIALAKANDVEVFSWAGGSHWQHRAEHVTHISGWYQNRPVEAQMGGAMMAVAGSFKATIFDAGPGWAPGGASVEIKVYARGALQAPVTLTVSSNNGGTFSKTTLTIPAGANGFDTFTFTPGANRVTTLTYASTSAPNVPPPRKVYSLIDPVAHAATNLADGAMALLAKYSAARWDMDDGYTDPLLGTPSAAGQELRAVSDTGYASSMGNEMDALNWFNTGSTMGPFTVPIMRTVNGRKAADLTGPNAFGLWCKKRLHPAERNPDGSVNFQADVHAVPVMPYKLDEPHFAIAAISVPSAGATGFVFQASAADRAHFSALELKAGMPQARYVNSGGVDVVTVPGTTVLAPNTPTTVALVSTKTSQKLRVGNTEFSGAGTLPTAEFDSVLLGCGFNDVFPRPSFGGFLFGVITGKGTPTADEMRVMESFLLA
jgi:endoglucanase